MHRAHPLPAAPPPEQESPAKGQLISHAPSSPSLPQKCSSTKRKASQRSQFLRLKPVREGFGGGRAPPVLRLLDPACQGQRSGGVFCGFLGDGNSSGPGLRVRTLRVTGGGFWSGEPPVFSVFVLIGGFFFLFFNRCCVFVKVLRVRFYFICFFFPPPSTVCL